MKLDWSVSVWQVGALIWLAFLFFFSVVRKLDSLISVFKEYPPHRHVGREVIYPKGMRPNGE